MQMHTRRQISKQDKHIYQDKKSRLRLNFSASVCSKAGGVFTNHPHLMVSL